jgi:uncharacterized protein
MLRNIIKFSAVMVFFSFFAAGNGIAAEPTLHQVYQAAEAGNYTAAQAMMDQVLRAHPNSAKAHFVEAELLAKQHRLAQAQTELATAERLEPGLPFAKQGAVEALKAQLSSPRSLGSASVYSPSVSAGFPWGTVLLGLGLIACVVLVVRMLRQRATYAGQSQMAPYSGGGVAPGQPYGPNPAGPLVPTGGGIGSGIMGGLATGAAVGAGMVAGEALMHRVLGGTHTDGTAVAADTGSWNRAEPQSDMGGDDFGVADAGSWDDSSSIGGDGGDWT